ncbi:hypothetical protein [Streptomyces sp. NPDC006551]|uniref:hypothetical protein n=1 Tax=Streptomyces sp. NPDC006551 TaxID=3157178 RepID=UPI0033BB0259
MTPSTAPAPVPSGRRRARHAVPGALLAAAAGLFALAGCGGDGDGSGGDGNPTQAVCADLADLKSQTGEMATMEPSGTVTDLQDMRADLSEDLGDVEDTAEGTAVRTDGLRAAFDRLDTSMDRLDRNMTGTAAVDQIKPDLDALTKAITDAERSAGCAGG